MDKISTIPGKLLFLAHQLSKENSISSHEKGLLKDLIFSQSPLVLTAFEDYIRNGTELTLKTTLVSIIRKEKQNIQNWQSDSSQSKKSSNKNRMKIIIPPRNIQKLPSDIQRLETKKSD